MKKMSGLNKNTSYIEQIENNISSIDKEISERKRQLEILLEQKKIDEIIKKVEEDRINLEKIWLLSEEEINLILERRKEEALYNTYSKNKRIDEYSDNTRLILTLKSWWINTLWELSETNLSELKTISNLGEKTIKEIIELLAKYWLKLKST